MVLYNTIHHLCEPICTTNTPGPSHSPSPSSAACKLVDYGSDEEMDQGSDAEQDRTLPILPTTSPATSASPSAHADAHNRHQPRQVPFWQHQPHPQQQQQQHERRLSSSPASSSIPPTHPHSAANIPHHAVARERQTAAASTAAAIAAAKAALLGSKPSAVSPRFARNGVPEDVHHARGAGQSPMVGGIGGGVSNSMTPQKSPLTQGARGGPVPFWQMRAPPSTPPSSGHPQAGTPHAIGGNSSLAGRNGPMGAGSVTSPAGRGAAMPFWKSSSEMMGRGGRTPFK